VQSEGFEGWVICCAYAPALREDDVSPDALRKALGEFLPGYMMPMRWLRYDALPKNANGKIDRPRLKTAFLEGQSPSAPAPAVAHSRPSPAHASS
jgi:acyl-coenzyme A synthetase/AMP-(fatty) acid ligase